MFTLISYNEDTAVITDNDALEIEVTHKTDVTKEPLESYQANYMGDANYDADVTIISIYAKVLDEDGVEVIAFNKNAFELSEISEFEKLIAHAAIENAKQKEDSKNADI